MKNKQSSNAPLVHIAIDVQAQYIYHLPDPQRITDFPASVRQFADALSEIGIPTVWIAYSRRYGGKIRPYARSLTRPVIHVRRDLEDVGVRNDETLIVKHHNDAFHASPLKSYLKGHKTKAILITGMNTRRCVKSTIKGAIKAGLKCKVIIDLLADTHTEARNDGDAGWHHRQLKPTVLQQLLLQGRGVTFLTSREFLQSHKTKRRPV